MQVRYVSDTQLICGVRHAKNTDNSGDQRGHMRVHVSTSTVYAYENTRKSMNLHYKPIMFFEDSRPFHIEFLKEIEWKIETSFIENIKFDVIMGIDSPFKIRQDRNYIDFYLSVKDVPFQYDPYECHLYFNALLAENHSPTQVIRHSSWGVVKTIWHKGLR